MLPVFTPYADPLIDALARESRNSTFLLQQAAEADLAANADWDEYLIRRALEFDPDNPDVVYKLGLILRAKQRNDEALALFQRYQQMVPEDVQGVAQIGSCLGDLGRFSEAESFLRRALLRLDDALTHYNLAFVLSRMGRLAEAKQEYELALQRDPNHVEARMNLAAVLLRQGNLDRAARELARVLEIEPDKRRRPHESRDHPRSAGPSGPCRPRVSGGASHQPPTTIRPRGVANSGAMTSATSYRNSASTRRPSRAPSRPRTGDLHNLVEGRELHPLGRHLPRTGQHFRILDVAVHFERVASTRR